MDSTPTARRIRRRRFPRLLAVLATLVALAASLARPVPAPAQVDEDEVVLDLPAMTLTPDDLDALDLAGYGVGFGQMVYPDGVIAWLADERDLGEEEIRDVLADAGFTRRYESYLYLPADEDEPAGPVGWMVVSYVLVFGDAAGAGDAWDLLEDESARESAEDLDLDETLGDEAEATLDRGEDPATGDRYRQIDLTIRLGNLHAGVAIVDWTGEEPDLDDAVALAERLLERIETTLDTGAPGLGGQALRLGGGEIAPSADYYVLRDGEALPLYGETRREIRSRAAAAERIDQTDGYRLWQLVAPGDGDAATEIWYLVQLSRFADEDAAEEWLAGTEERIAANTTFTAFALDEEAPIAGDDSLTYTLEADDLGTRYRSVSLRVGATVATIDLVGPESPPAAAVEALAAAQAACLEEGGCVEALPLPEALAVYAEDPSRTEDGGEEERPARSDDPPSAAGERYVSPTWGYEVRWDADQWVASGEEREEGIELHVVGSVIVLVTIQGVEDYDGDPEACLEGMVAATDSDNLAPAEHYPAPATVDEAAGELFELGDFAVVYFECRPLVAGEAVLQVRFAAPADEYEAVLPALDALLAGIRVDPDAAMTTPYAG